MKNKVQLIITLELDDESKTPDYLRKEVYNALSDNAVFDVVEETCTVEAFEAA